MSQFNLSCQGCNFYQKGLTPSMFSKRSMGNVHINKVQANYEV